MQSKSFLVRFTELVRKSKEAVKLYSALEKTSLKKSATKNELEQLKSERHAKQLREWKEVNQKLFDHLILMQKRGFDIIEQLYNYLDELFSEYRQLETELHKESQIITSAVNTEQFVKAAGLCDQLIISKARKEALEAVLSEIQEILNWGKVARDIEKEQKTNSNEVDMDFLDQQEEIPENVISIKASLERRRHSH